MKAQRALLDAYAEWRRLAEAAKQAIRSRNWPFVLECQEVIRQLQPRISQLTVQAKSEWQRTGTDPVAAGEKLHSAVLELIKLVESNKALINSVQARVESEHKQRQQSVQNLKRLQQSYAAGHCTAWSSFS
jgi:hypothetical protein